MKTLSKAKSEIFIDRDYSSIPVMVPNSSAEPEYRNWLAFSDIKSNRFRKLFNRHDMAFKG